MASGAQRSRWAPIVESPRRIVRVLVPKTSQIVGRCYFTDAGVGYSAGRWPSRLRHSYPARRRHGRADGFVVVVELTQRPTHILKRWENRRSAGRQYGHQYGG